MKREFLQNLKVGELFLTKDVIDAIMAENGRDIESAKAAGNAWEEKYNQAAEAHRQEVESLRFQQALEAAGRKNPDYDVNKWLYVPNFYSEYRYILGTRGKNPLICIGINPSTAKPDDLDNTLKSVERIAHHNGFDSFIMFNVYAQRATDPDAMEKQCNPLLHKENMEAFSYVLSISEKPAVWAAWGTIIEKRDYLPACLRDMLEVGQTYGARWYCAGEVSKKGHPHHPLYLRKDEKIRPFDVEQYLENLAL